MCHSPAAAPVQSLRPQCSLQCQPVLATLIRLHNQHRGKVGLPPLTIHTSLMQAAQIQAQYMAEHAKTTHAGPGRHDAGTAGQTTRLPLREDGGKRCRWPRNTRSRAAGLDAQPSPPTEHPGTFSDIGAARATGTDGRPYWCVVFGAPLPTLDPHPATATVSRLPPLWKHAAGISSRMTHFAVAL